MSIKIEVWGEYACFAQPPMKTERVTSDVMTPSAARGLVESIYWHPGMRYCIEKIHVLNPIRFTNIRRNEVKDTLSSDNVFQNLKKGEEIPAMNAAEKDNRQQRAALLLRDVRYVIEVHFEITDKAAPGDNDGKFQSILRRRLSRGQCYSQPYFGCREFAAHFREWPGGEIPDLDLNQELGYMLYDMDYSDPENIQARFFRARLEHGVLDCRDCEVVS